MTQKSNIRANTQVLIMAAQEQALNTRAVAHEIYYIVQDPPDIVLINYKEQTGLIIDIVVPKDENIQDKEPKKLTNISH